MFKSRLSLLTCLALCALVGCDSAPDNPPTTPVTGTVTYKKKPVEGALVVLVAQTPDAQGAVGTTDADGNYAVSTFADGDGAVAGTYKVKVSKYEIVAEPAAEGGDMSEEEEEDEYSEEDMGDEQDSGNLLPSKYENEITSGFEVTVGDEPVTLDLELK
ncbi:MAG TPA: hypothetical protein DDW52_00625 [Planctomycetaceae bacterium]|nr:hypothetical protein [Planctomycetaceae bacterium]